MFWNIHLESVNLKNYSLICEAFKWELRVGESESFFEPENLGWRDFLKIQSWKLKQQNNYDPLAHAYELWAANELLAVFAPAFPLSLLRQEIRPQPAQAHSLGR